MTRKANAESLRSIIWNLSRAGIDPADPEAVRLAITAPADWLDRFNPDSFAPDFRRAGEALKAAGTIRRSAAKLDRLNELECNGIERFDPAARRMVASWTDADAERADADRLKASNAILAALAALIGEPFDSLSVRFNRDPRGVPVRVFRAGETESGSPLFYL